VKQRRETAGVSNVAVLVVDDHEPYRDVMQMLIGAMDGFAVVGAAASAEEALVLVADLHPDLVMMDIVMDGLGGIGATRSITTSDPNVLVVLVSTYGDDELPNGARTCGAGAYIAKHDLSAKRIQCVWNNHGDSAWRAAAKIN
jgi:two-component system, NarL family, invasion response regulator UvrY